MRWLGSWLVFSPCWLCLGLLTLCIGCDEVILLVFFLLGWVCWKICCGCYWPWRHPGAPFLWPVWCLTVVGRIVWCLGGVVFVLRPCLGSILPSWAWWGLGASPFFVEPSPSDDLSFLLELLPLPECCCGKGSLFFFKRSKLRALPELAELTPPLFWAFAEHFYA